MSGRTKQQAQSKALAHQAKAAAARRRSAASGVADAAAEVEAAEGAAADADAEPPSLVGERRAYPAPPGREAWVRSPPTPTHKTCLLSAVGDLK